MSHYILCRINFKREDSNFLYLVDNRLLNEIFEVCMIVDSQLMNDTKEPRPWKAATYATVD